MFFVCFTGPWRPLFKPSQILKTEFPEHESFHEEVDSHYRNMLGDHVDNHLRLPSTPSSEHLSTGPDNSGGFSGSGINYNGGGGYGGSVSVSSSAGAGPAKKHNHMIHLHLIPHIYVPIMHSAGFSEAKNYQATIEDGSSLSSPVQNSADTSSEFHVGDGAATSGSGQSDTSNSAGGAGENPSSATAAAGPTGDHENGNFNGHSGETSYYTITDDAVQHLHQDLHDQYGNGIDNNHNHEYEAPPDSVPDEPHQYQVYYTIVMFVFNESNVTCLYI